MKEEQWTTEWRKVWRLAKEIEATCGSHIWGLSSLTFWLVFDQLLHLALLQCVHDVGQAALASLGGPEGACGRAAVAAGAPPASALLFAR